MTGATATGKSDFAFSVAREVGGVIVNCDSVQVYRGPEIGSNVPSLEDRAQARHLLYSYVDSPREMTAGEFRRDFFAAMGDLPDRKPVFVVGGTGFYFQALEKGMYDVPEVSAELSRVVREESATEAGRAALWAELQAGDPETAARLAAADHYRICRAVELLRAGVPASSVRQAFRPEPFPFPLLKTGVRLERSVLRSRIARRTDRMMARGLVEETRDLLTRVPSEWAPMRAVGYKETVQALHENLGRDWLAAEISLRTAQLARRQETWFKRDRDIAPFSGEDGLTAFRECCLRFFDAAGRLESP